MENEIECTECGWEGNNSQLICRKGYPPVSTIYCCPGCDSVDCFHNVDDD